MAPVRDACGRFASRKTACGQAPKKIAKPRTKKAPVVKEWWLVDGDMRQWFGACQEGWDEAVVEFRRYESLMDFWKNGAKNTNYFHEWFVGASSGYCLGNVPYYQLSGMRAACHTLKADVAARHRALLVIFPAPPVSKKTLAKFPHVFDASKWKYMICQDAV